MNEADNKVKTQLVEKIKASTNILVTVSNDPTVDDLSAALGLTMLLNKIDKHATAIFSGIIPPAISFLEPDKVFENSTDSLRDFIIALDKEKADHLRYKVEGDVVKIFITPYRTNITSDDLEFSQGDYNVELVLALGVANQEHLDTALAANGLMLHDVTIMTVSAGEQSSQLGSADWRDQTASSLSEMVAVLGEALKTDKTLLDKQISTALLTGIVSSTERFSNTKTTSKVMTMASQLMASGADQQLIAAKLQESHEINSLPGSAVEKEEAAKPSADELVINHSTLPEPVPEVPAPEPIAMPVVETVIEPVESTIPIPASVESTIPTLTPAKSETLPELITSKPKLDVADEPLLGGILNANSDQPAEDAIKELDEQQNKTILTHSYLTSAASDIAAPINSATQAEDTKMVDIFADNPTSTLPSMSSVSDLPLPPPLPDFSTLPPPSAASDLSLPIPPPPTPSPAAEQTVTSPMSTLAPNSSDPSQFQIPM